MRALDLLISCLQGGTSTRGVLDEVVDVRKADLVLGLEELMIKSSLRSQTYVC